MSATPSAGISGHHVFLQLAAREKGLFHQQVGTSMNNRIAMKCDSITITTAKQVPSFAIPFSGLVAGESTNIGIDLGMTNKTVSLTGIITNQTIQKAFPSESLDTDSAKTALSRSSIAEFTTSGGFDIVTVEMTAHEISQLIHSYVDSSLFQRQQNLNELIILYPSYVSSYYAYHTDTLATEATRVVENATMVPFNWGSRFRGKGTNKLDNQTTLLHTPFPDAFDSATAEAEGLQGFIRQFNTPWAGGNPFVEFTLDFEVAIADV